MAIKRSRKANPNFNMSSMTDIVFLLLIFFMVTSTLINPNALKYESHSFFPARREDCRAIEK